MNRLIQLAIGVLCLAGTALAQTAPTPQSIPYTQDFSALAHASTTYPTGMVGWQLSGAATGSFVTGGPTGDRALIASSSASNNSGGIHNYNGKMGILTSGSTNPGIVLSLITTGNYNVTVSYDIMLIRNPYDGASNTRINEATLQYRIGNTGTWTTLTGIEYQSNTTLQTGSGVTTPLGLESRSISLPNDADNQPEVQIRWLVRDMTGAGSRPSFAVDNISVEQDFDGDGFVASDDCDDNNPTVYPGAAENCNGIDDDCDGDIDEGTFALFYIDVDTDLYGDPAVSTLACVAPFGYVGNDLDCDDTNAAINPLATEICNGVDDDCDGLADDADPDVVGMPIWFADADGDTYGDAVTTTFACNQPVGYVADPSDCDDTQATVYPGATEICDGLDNDCNGDVDDALTFTTYYEDLDGDGFGDAASFIVSCSPSAPVGYTTDNTDCIPGFITYADADGDGFGFGAPVPCGPVINNIDCDDTQWLYADADGDTYGSGPAIECGVPSNTDCDPMNASVNPGATEICDGIDNNCDGNIDNDLITASVSPTGTVYTCKGTAIELMANTGVGYTYIWYKNGNPIPGATASSYFADKPAFYTVQVTIPGGCSDVSDATLVQLYANPNANISAPLGTSLCTTVKLKASFNATYTYQWREGVTPIAGETNYIYFPTAAGNYRCTVTSADGCSRNTASIAVTACRETDIAEQAELLVYPNPTSSDITIAMSGLLNEQTNATVQILDITGRVVLENTLNASGSEINTTLNLQSLEAAGMYFVRVTTAHHEYVSSFVLQR